MRDIQVRGFSKDGIRLQYDTHEVLIEDMLGDSERQDGDDFTEGLTIDGTAHDIVLRRVTMRNAHDTLHPFWNGDGFATEPGAYRIRFEDTVATGSTDAGYDLKSSDTVLVRAKASDNARNFKLWGRNITLIECVGTAPHRRGGIDSQEQVQVLRDASVRLQGCRFADDDAATTIFSVEDRASITLADTTITRHPGSTASRVAPTGKLHTGPFSNALR